MKGQMAVWLGYSPYSTQVSLLLWLGKVWPIRHSQPIISPPPITSVEVIFFFIDFYKFSSVFFLFTLHVSLFIHTRDVFRSITIIWKHSKEDLCIFLFYTTHNRDKMLFRIVDNSVSVSLLCLVRGLWKFVDEVTCEQHWLTTCCQILYGWLFMLNLSFQCYSLTEYKYSPGHFIHLMLINKSFILLYCLWF